MRDFYIYTGYEHRADRDKIRIDPIDKDKHQRENKALERDFRHSPLAMLGTIIVFIKKNIEETLNLEVVKTPDVEIDPSIKLFDKLRHLITLLQIQDHSQNIEYAKNLSSTWHSIIDYYIPTTLDRLPSKEAKQSINQFIGEVRKYPKDSDHSLGYYLTNYAGEHWLPFPFMKILRKLHEDHVTAPTHSFLSKWTKDLTKIIKILAPPTKQDEEKK